MPASEQYIPTEEWNDPLPEVIPRPTYWPIVFALGVNFLLFGVVTRYVMSGVGLILLVIALVGWIGEMRHDQRNES